MSVNVSISIIHNKPANALCIHSLVYSFYTSTESMKGYIFTSVCWCVCVCLSVCLCPFVNKMPIKSIHRFWRGLRKIVAYCSHSNSIEIDISLLKLKFVSEFDKIRMGDDVIVTSFKFSANYCPYFKFY